MSVAGTAQRSGLVSFSAVLFTIAGFFNAIEGLGALFKKEYFDEASLLYENLQVWAWVWLIVGLLQLIAAYLIVGRATSGRTIGVVMASLSAVVWFFSIGAHPIAAVVVLALDVLIIYGLTVHRDLFVPGGVVEGGPIASRPETSGRPYA